MSKTLAIVQSNYIPWKGYFDLINFADEFVFLDEVQYTRRDWRNRNQIKTPGGLHWLTIPVQTRGKYLQPINETRVDGAAWRSSHWRTLSQNYSRATYFHKYQELFEDLYLGSAEDRLSEVNRAFIAAVCDILGIRTPQYWSSDFDSFEEQADWLVALRKQGSVLGVRDAVQSRAALSSVISLESRLQEPCLLAERQGSHPGTNPSDPHSARLLPVDSSDPCARKNGRLIHLCKQTGANIYLSGPSARSYLDETWFCAEGIAVKYIDYNAYPAYRQLYAPFEHEVTILDLIFNEGPNAYRYLKSFA